MRPFFTLRQYFNVSALMMLDVNMLIKKEKSNMMNVFLLERFLT